jgi:eukaryotic-like serine/threonine-protein kinase
LVWERQRMEKLRVAVNRSQQSAIEAREQRALAQYQGLLAQRHDAASQLKIVASYAERGDNETARSILDEIAPPYGPSDTRAFAWHYLDRVLGPHIRALPELPAAVRRVGARRDGQMIALADDAGNTLIVDLSTGKSTALPAEPGLTFCHRLVFSPGGETLAAVWHGSRDNDWTKCAVKLWNVANAVELLGMPRDFGFCYELLFSPGGEAIVTVEAYGTNPDKSVRSWRVSADRKRVTPGESLRGDQLRGGLTRAFRNTLPAQRPFQISDAVAVTPEDGSTTAIMLAERVVRLYTMVNGYCKAVCLIRGDEVVCIPRTDLLVRHTQARIDEICRLARMVTGLDRARPIDERDAVVTTTFSPDGCTAAILDRSSNHMSCRLRLVDVATGRLSLESPWNQPTTGCSFEFAPADHALIVVGLGNQPRLWDFSGRRAPATLDGHKKEVWGLAFSRDGRSLVSSSDDSTLKIWDVAWGQEQRTLTGHASLITAVAYSPDGELLASAGWDKTIRLWNAASGAAIATLSGHTEHVRTLAFSPDSKTLASAGDDKLIWRWDMATRSKLAAPLAVHTERVSSVAFALDGTTLYSDSLDKTIRLWDWRKSQLRATWLTDDQVLSLALSPDGRTLAVAQPHGTIRLWDVVNEKAHLVLRGHVGEVMGINFSPDGLTLASAGRDHSVRLWDPVTGREVLTLKGHTAPVHTIAFSPDGTILATGSHDGAIKLWWASPKLKDQQDARPIRYVSSRSEH